MVNDSHWTMQNLPPAELHGRSEYISGKHKPLYMMEGLDGSFDAVFFVAYHGSIGAEVAVLSHTYNPKAVSEVHAERHAGRGELGSTPWSRCTTRCRWRS